MNVLHASLVALCLASLGACGDASVNSSEQFHGVGGTGQPNKPSSDAGATSDASGGGADGGAVQAGSLSVLTASATADVELRNVTTPMLVTVAPSGFTGAVTLTVADLPTGVTAAFDKNTLTVTGNTGASAMLTLTTKSDVAVGSTKLSVVATSGTTLAKASLMLNVKPLITLTIPMNVDAMKGTPGNPSTKAFGDFPIVVSATADLTKTPIMVKVLNKDSSGHCIHASNPTQGFAHDPVNNGVCTALTQKDQFGTTVRAINAVGSYKFYLHDQGDLTDGMLKVQ